MKNSDPTPNEDFVCPLVAVIIPTTGAELVRPCIESVLKQSYANMKIFVVIDGPEYASDFYQSTAGLDLTTCFISILPANVGRNGFYGHRIYAAYSHLIDADYICFLDQDNWIEPEHITTLIEAIQSNSWDWGFALRKIVNAGGAFLMNDDSQSIGPWGETSPHKLIDTSCYCISVNAAVQVASFWHGGWGQDRIFYAGLARAFPNFGCSGKYTVNYRTNCNLEAAVIDLLTRENELMRTRYPDVFPWVAASASKDTSAILAPTVETLQTPSESLVEDPTKLLTSHRFDINAKTLFGRHRDKGVQCNYYIRLYLEHLRVWNHFYESSPPKNTPHCFINAFEALLDSIKSEGFRADADPVPILDGSPYNGAHRVAASIVFQSAVRTTTNITSGKSNCNWKFFQDKKDLVPEGLGISFTDSMALEFCRNKRSIHTISLFGADQINTSFADTCVEEYTNVVYEKNITLSEIGKFNYIKNLYWGEPWMGTYENDFAGLHFKKQACFLESNCVKVYLTDCDNIEQLRACKSAIRAHYNRQNHSVHIDDTYEQAWNIATSVFNENSIHFLNHANQLRYPNFQRLLSLYKTWITRNNLDSEDLCIVSSAIMSAYGLRDCRDIDYISHSDHSPAPSTIEIGNHNKESIHYGVHRDEIIYNPENHLYIDGLKFSTLLALKVLKWKRQEPKDLVDLKIILDFEDSVVR